MKSELLTAVSQLASEKGVPEEVVLEALEQRWCRRTSATARDG